MTDYHDPEVDERADDIGREIDEREQFYRPGCQPFCRQCRSLMPLWHALNDGGWNPHLETRMGGGMHAIYVDLTAGRYAYLNDEGFSIYDGEDAADEIAGGSWSTDDPPNLQQQVTLFRLKVAQMTQMRTP